MVIPTDHTTANRRVAQVSNLAKEITEHAELMIEESIEVIRAIDAGRDYPKRSHLGTEYDAAYAQGRKDACRVLMLCIDPLHRGPRSTDP
jgi:hypothetical protein